MNRPHALFFLLGLASAHAHCLAQVTPLSTRRETSAFASGGSLSDSRFDANNTFSPFRSVRTVCITTPLGNTGCAVGTQESGFDSDRFWAVGQGGASTTPGPDSDLGSSSGRSTCEIRFRVDAPIRYWLSGSIRAVNATSFATLFSSAPAVILQFNESFSETTLDAAGILNPGIYELHLGAEASVDPSVEAGSTSADFNATFRWLPYCPADFNADGFTDFFDFDDFVACFEGSCPDGLSADFNADGFTDFFDFDDFVSAFDAGC